MWHGQEAEDIVRDSFIPELSIPDSRPLCDPLQPGGALASCTSLQGSRPFSEKKPQPVDIVVYKLLKLGNISVQPKTFF